MGVLALKEFSEENVKLGNIAAVNVLLSDAD